jgi:hypothetical protein
VDLRRPVDLRVVFLRPVDLRAAVRFRPVVFLRPVDLRAAVRFRPVVFLRPVDLRAAVRFRPVVFLRPVDLRAVDFLAVDLRAVDFRAAVLRVVLRPVDFLRPVVFFAATPLHLLIVHPTSPGMTRHPITSTRLLTCDKLQIPQLPRTRVAQTRIQCVITHEVSRKCKY